jgi:geranylgeranyl diphosphate synthase type II
VLNLVGDAAVYGKETGGDLREGKRTLMIIRLLQLASPAERDRLVAYLGTALPARGEADARWIRDRMDHHGCIDHASRVARAMARAALAEFARLFAPVPPSRDRDFLEALITWVVERTG